MSKIPDLLSRLLHPIHPSIPDMLDAGKEIQRLRADCEKLEKAHGQNIKEIDALYADLAAERARAERFEKGELAAHKALQKAEADLAAAREAIKDAYFEGWGDAHECGNDRYDWDKSWAKRVYESSCINAMTRGGGSD